jgi:flagellar motor protein MotB
MRRVIFAVTLLVVGLALSMPAMAIELSPDAKGVPFDFAKKNGDKWSFDEAPAAYDSVTFNAILGSYGLALSTEAVAQVPNSYAKVSGDKVMFNEESTAYTPADYHKIFTAYGLLLTPEDAAKIPSYFDYVTVTDGKMKFGNVSTAYSAMGINTILAAYSLPIIAVIDTECIDSDGDMVCDEVDVCVGTPLGVEVDARGCWVLEQTYLFDFDKFEVKPEFYPLLDKIAKVLADNPKMTLKVEGHTDSVGTAVYNMGLSERRAGAIKGALVQRNNVAADRVDAVGYGEEKPIATNETAEGRALNRRVELTPVW